MGVYIGPVAPLRSDYGTVEEYVAAWNRMVERDEAHGYHRIDRKDPSWEKDYEEAFNSFSPVVS